MYELQLHLQVTLQLLETSYLNNFTQAAYLCGQFHYISESQPEPLIDRPFLHLIVCYCSLNCIIFLYISYSKF